MKVNEIFESLQGEGRYIGHPALFIRLQGCNKNCKYCDTEWKTGDSIETRNLIDIINNSNKKIIVWTGGEPTLQYQEIREVMALTKSKSHHLETNGSLLTGQMFYSFEYLAISPKDIIDARNVKDFLKSNGQLADVIHHYDIKVVTDCIKTNLDIIPFATMLMPLETGKPKTDQEIRQTVWNYCQENNIIYSARLHTQVFGFRKRGI